MASSLIASSSRAYFVRLELEPARAASCIVFTSGHVVGPHRFQITVV
jgi:hypothetical protein